MPTNESSFHTIFFDVGGTLLRPTPSVGAVYSEVAARYGIHVDPEEVEAEARRLFPSKREEGLEKAVLHTTSLEIAKKWWREVVRLSLGRAADSPRFEAYFQAVFEEFALPERFTLFAEVPGLLHLLEERGYKLGIVSNWDIRLQRILDGLDLTRRFSTIVISGEAGVEKPDPRIYEIARTRAGAGRGEPLLHIGDNAKEDVQAASAAGFDARLIDRSSGQTLLDVLADMIA